LAGGRRRPDDEELRMPEKQTVERARQARRQGKSPSTQAGEFVREEMHHIREGKHGARSSKQAIAIGLSKARRSGVDVPDRSGRSSNRKDRSTSSGRSSGRTGRRASAKRSRASSAALRREGRSAASHSALSRQGKSAASRRSAADRSRAARQGARTKGAAGRAAAARKAARTRAAS
jgi:hypothetical protein